MEEEIKNKITAAVKAGKKIKDIAEKLYMSEHQLRILLKSWGVSTTTRRRFTDKPAPSREELMIKYNELGNTEKLAKAYDVSVNKVITWINDYNIPTKKMAKMTEEEKAKYLESHLEKLTNIEL